MSRRRPTWPELPGDLRGLIEDRLGSPVIGWVSHDSGYSPGPALTLVAGGERLFVKAADVSAHPVSADLHRREIAVASHLPVGVPAPALRWSVDDDWVVLAFDAVDGRPPRTPWDAAELDLVTDLVETLATVPATAGLPAVTERMVLDHWRRLATEGPDGLESYGSWAQANLDRLAAIEPSWTDAVTGDVLVHNDFRGDNVLIADGRAVAIDWPFAARGAAFCDLVAWLPSLRLEGGPEPEAMLRSTRIGAAADEAAVTAYIVAVSGYFVRNSLEPPPPGIPHLRAFQRAQGEVCLDWLRLRLDA